MTKYLSNAFVLCCMAALLGSCGGGSSNSSPTTPSTAVDLTGTWVLTDNTITVTWKLTQSGNAVNGTSLQADPLDPQYGADGIPGVVTGTVANGSFTYVDTYATTKVSGCKETDSGVLQITGGTMGGRNTANNSCTNPVPVSGTVSFKKQ